MNLPYDEDYLREMELWTFFELRSQSSMPSAMQSITSVHNADISTPVQPGAAVGSKTAHETPRHSAPGAQRPVSNAHEASPLKLRVLRPAQVESWQSSSFDLLSGLQVRDVTDTIPGCVFDELFKGKRTED